MENLKLKNNMYKLLEKIFKIKFAVVTTYADEEYIRRIYFDQTCKSIHLYGGMISILRDDGTCSLTILKSWRYL